MMSGKCRRVKTNGLPGKLNRPVVVAFGLVTPPSLVGQVDAEWPEVSCNLVCGDGTVEVLLVPQSITQVDVACGGLRVEADCLPVRGDGPVQVLFGTPCVAQVDVGGGIIQFEVNCLSVFSEGRVRA